MRKPGGAWALGALLGGSGVLHLVRPRTYERMVPPELGSARSWMAQTGVAEIGTAALAVALVRLPMQVQLVVGALRVARPR